MRVPKWSEHYPLFERTFYRIGKCRYQWAEQRASCRIVKMIRGNLLLAWLVKNFELPVLYLVRHPCAVVASRLRWNWPSEMDGVFGQEPLVRDHLQPYVEVMRTCSTPLERMAALWCVENLVPLSQLPLVNVRAATYESFTDDPQRAFADLFLHFDLTPTRRTEKAIGHKVSNAKSRTKSDDWHAGLGERDGARVLEICRQFGIQLYGRQLQPVTALDDALAPLESTVRGLA